MSTEPVAAQYQYNTIQLRGALNAQFSWEFAPLSFLNEVYNDRQAILDGTSPSARSVIVKLSWLRQMWGHGEPSGRVGLWCAV